MLEWTRNNPWISALLALGVLLLALLPQLASSYVIQLCISIYATDPNGIMVEFCHTTRPFSDEEVAQAHRYLMDPAPPDA